MRSAVLFNDHPLVVPRAVAEKFGLRAAIILQQVHYWCELNRKREEKSGSKSHYKNGRWWMWNSVSGWTDEFGSLWSSSSIERTLSKLRKSGVLIGEVLSSRPSDRTLWYSIDYENLESLINVDETVTPTKVEPLPQNDEMDHSLNLTDPFPQNDEVTPSNCRNQVTETTSKNTSKTNPPPSSSENQQQPTTPDQPEEVKPPIPEHNPIEPDYEKIKAEEDHKTKVPPGMPDPGNRPLIEDTIRRCDPMRFQTIWFEIFRPMKWNNNPQNMKRFRFICKYWTEDELRRAMVKMASGANSPGWGYYRKVLENMPVKGSAPKRMTEAERMQAKIDAGPQDQEFELGKPLYEMEGQ